MKNFLKRLIALMLVGMISFGIVDVEVLAGTVSELTNQENVSEKSDSWDGVTMESVYSGENFKVTFSLSGYWDSGFNANVKVENTGDTVIENWSLGLDYDGRISNVWNAVISDKAEGYYVIKNAGWNQDIPLGGFVEFGMSEQENFCGFPNEYQLLGDLSEVGTEDYTISYEVEGEWGSGFSANLSITNHTNAVIEDWILEFDFDREITEIWNGIIESHEKNHYVVRNAGYNSNLNAGETLNIGFNGSGGTVDDEPCSYVVCEYKDATKENKEEEKQNSGTENIINAVTVTENVVFTNQDYRIRIYSEIDDAEMKEDYFVGLYRLADNTWDFYSELYDSGDLGNHGDEIKNDGIYSNYLDVNEQKIGQMKLKVVVSDGAKELDCQEITIDIVEKVGESDLNDYNKGNEIIREYVDQRIADITEEISSAEMASELKELLAGKDVREIVSVDDWTVKVIYNKGMSVYVQIADDSDMELMRRGGYVGVDTGVEDGENIEYLEVDDFDYNLEDEAAQDYTYVLSNKVLMWNPFDTEWGDNDETKMVCSCMELSPYGIQVDVVSDSDADIASLKKMSDYGVIVLATHGLEGQWIATGEEYVDASNYADEIQAGELSVLIRGELSTDKSQSIYMVNYSWIENNVAAEFPNSIFINNSCSSLSTDDFWDVLKEKGVKTYYGYSASVTNDYVVMQTESLLYGLVCEEKSTEESFEYSYDRQYGGGFFGIRGCGNILLPFGLMNGSFERGLCGWNTNGDGRYITKLGNVMPTDGCYMGIISTGLGFTQELGEIRQTFCIPELARELSFDWNFLSEEFLEYIGSKYDDPFEVKILLQDENGSNHILLHMDVNSVAEDFGASSTDAAKLIAVSPDIVFDRGDVWMTGWQTAKIDISDYAGETVTLIFSVKDAIDTIYTTAILLDNIRFDIGNIILGEERPISEAYMDEAINERYRGINAWGKSYVFYDPNNFSGQAIAEKKWIFFFYGYSSRSQVELQAIRTENEFVRYWNQMDNGERRIDKVSLLFHGTFYAIILNEKKTENLTTSPNGLVGSDDDATYIRDLGKKKIETINILTCNGGLLDAINYNDDITSQGKTFRIKGNVAQAFLDSQDVKTVQAWDGSMAFFSDNTNVPRLAKNQSPFEEKLKMVATKRVFKPIRYIRIDTKKKVHLLPYGKLSYTRTKGGKLICRYGLKCSVTGLTGSPLIEKEVVIVDDLS